MPRLISGSGSTAPSRGPGQAPGQKYGYGISLITFGPNKIYYHGGEMPGYKSFMGYDPVNDVTLVIWTNLTLSLDGRPTANTLMLKNAGRDLCRVAAAVGRADADRRAYQPIPARGSLIRAPNRARS